MIEIVLGAAVIVVTAAWWKARGSAALANATLLDVVEGMPEGFVLWDRHDRLVTWSGSVSDVYGQTGPNLKVGMTFEELIRRGVEMDEYPAAAQRREAFVAEMLERHRATGTTECELVGGRWIRVRERRTPSGGTVGLRSEITDLRHALAEAEESRATVEYLANHDALTGLPNRRLFLERVDRSLRERRSAALYVDLDGFKSVNDRLGHPAGDELLRAVAVRLREAVSEDDLVARLGGDEFGVLISAGSDAEAIADRIVTFVSQPFELENGTAGIGASVGLAVAVAGEGAHHLLRRADEALYASKRSGGRGVRLWSPSERAAA